MIRRFGSRLILQNKAVISLLTRNHKLFIKPAPDFVPKLTTPDLIALFTRKIGAPLGQKVIADRLERHTQLAKLLPASQEELPPRKMEDSFLSAIVPLGKDSRLRERYVTYSGIRVGRLLEDLDVFAAACCYEYIRNPKSEGHASPYSIITALVESINFSGDYFQTERDVRISGHVSWVGKTSMEVCVQVDQKNKDDSVKIMIKAIFVMVARDPLNQHSAFINPLLLETDEEKAYVAKGAERNQNRKMTNQESLTNKAPTEEEREIIHKLFQSTMVPRYGGFRSLSEQKIKPPPITELMADCRLNTLMVCHPQYKNRFGKIFGGFIMRQAFELAFSAVYLYTKSRPQIIHMDDIVFQKPVEIGSILRFGVEIGYVEGDYVHTPVIAEVLNAETGESEVTNIFHFTFLATGDTKPRTLLPQTYQEAMVYLSSRRVVYNRVLPVNSKK